MRLLVIRHGIAGDREAFARSGRPDDERPLTPKGRRRMRRNARGLRTLVTSVDVLATSPLVRAAQTADLVADAYEDEPERAARDELRPESPLDAVGAWLRAHPAGHTVAVVGHEPQLSRLVSWLLAGEDRSLVRLAKGGACLLSFDGAPGPRCATLEWLLQPRELRALD